MYYPYFISYIGIGLAISFLVFFWALRNGQFKDQQRARFLPLKSGAGEIDPAPAVLSSRFARIQAYGLFVLAVCGLAFSAAALLFAAFFKR